MKLPKLPYWCYKLAGVLLMIWAALWLQKKWGLSFGGFLLIYLVMSIGFVVFLLYATPLGRRQLAGVKMTAELLRNKKRAEEQLKCKKEKN